MFEDISKQKTKQELWEERLKRVAERLDVNDRGMEPEIIEMVAILNLLKIPTSGSCEGHLDHGLANPWVAVMAENKPGERFINETIIKESIAKEFVISVDDVGYGDNDKANNKFWSVVENIDETSEYKKWQEENKKLAEIIIRWIKEFYNDAVPKENVAINLIGIGGAAGIIQAGQSEERIYVSENERDTLAAERLRARQEEMKKFTQFLKQKYMD